MIENDKASRVGVKVGFCDSRLLPSLNATKVSLCTVCRPLTVEQPTRRDHIRKVTGLEVQCLSLIVD